MERATGIEPATSSLGIFFIGPLFSQLGPLLRIVFLEFVEKHVYRR